jgi:hypothetical protein
MDEEHVRDYLPHFAYALMKAGAPLSTIERFRTLWNALPSGAARLPCPLCYASGAEGTLVAIRTAGALVVSCQHCHEQFPIGRH